MERVLRTYERVSERIRTCSYCRRNIWPGDLYEGTVVVKTRVHFTGTAFVHHRQLEIQFRHVQPDCWGSDPKNFEETLEDTESCEENLAA